MATGAEALIIALAIATLTSGFSDGIILINKLKAKWRLHRERSKSNLNLASVSELENLEHSLEKARDTVKETYEAEYRQHGQ